MTRYRPKVAVIVKQWRAILDAPGADQKIDGLTNGDSDTAQIPEIASCGDSNPITGHCYYCETTQDGLDFSSMPFA
jgi:hypothetical protein